MQINKCLFSKKVNYHKVNGKTKLEFWNQYNPDRPYYLINCSRCVYCQRKRSVEWSTRLKLESENHKEKIFVTLTYNDKFLPEGNSLKKSDIQKFIKRLRRKIEPKRIRYYYVGEYGGKTNRPHYHIIIFGWSPNDLKLLKETKKKEKIYTSEELSKVWKWGFSSIGIDLEFESLKYITKYMSKLQKLKNGIQEPPFNHMSTKPGIGKYQFSEKYYETDGIYILGKKYKIPKYYDSIMEKLNPKKLEEIKENRKKWNAEQIEEINEKDIKKYFNFIEQNNYDNSHIWEKSQKWQKKILMKNKEIEKYNYEEMKYNIIEINEMQKNREKWYKENEKKITRINK